MTDLDRVTDLFEKWAAEEDEHRQASEYGLAEGLRVAIEDLREAIHGHRAETTTATDEDATVEQVADALEHWDRGIDWRLAEQENLTRAAYLRGAEQLLGLLATARTRPTREHALKKAYRDRQQPIQEDDAWAFGEGVRAGVDAVLALLADQPTEAEAGARALEQAADTLGTRGRMSPPALRDRAADLRGGDSQ